MNKTTKKIAIICTAVVGVALISTTLYHNNTLGKDGDGLTYREEKDLGTNPYEYDSDFDQLSDLHEAEVLGTDPTKTDTDGDGSNDNQEINDGTDPLVAN